MNGSKTKSDRLRPGWAIDCAISYFGLTEYDVRKVSGSAGRDLLLDMWNRQGAGLYDSPYYALRQEWFHTFLSIRRSPVFFERLRRSAVVLDWGCGTAEFERCDWIDKGGRTILVDIENDNFQYTKSKYEGLNVSFKSPIDSIDEEVDVLICLDVLEHLENPMQTLNKIWEYLKPGGTALLWFDHSYPHPGHIKSSIDKIPVYEHWIRKNTEIVKLGPMDIVRKHKNGWWRGWNVVSRNIGVERSKAGI